MNHEEAQAIGLMLKNAGYRVQIILNVDEPVETSFSILAQMEDDTREAWMMVHLRTPADIAALGLMVAKMNEDLDTEP